jgi:hypothetical protein
MNNRSKTIAMIFMLAMVATLMPVAAPGAEASRSAGPTYLYKTTFVRAAPGKLLDLIALYKGRMEVYDASGDTRPFWWRHAEGDQWDLMFLIPMGSYADYYAQEKLARRRTAAEASSFSTGEFQDKLDACSAWREDIFVMGPPLESVKKTFEGTSFYHLEIFISLPGKQAELYKEREMENVYQVAIGRPEPMIFVRDQGAAWDMYTLGCYKDMKQWAGTGDIPKETKERAARQAGFRNPDEIGPTMRTFIDMHRDTMGSAIK